MKISMARMITNLTAWGRALGSRYAWWSRWFPPATTVDTNRFQAQEEPYPDHWREFPRAWPDGRAVEPNALEAAHSVCGADDDIEDDTLELLTGLLDKSMVKMRIGADRSRYFLLETLRAYGRDRLRENGIADDVMTRHAQYYTELAERAAIGMHGPNEGPWVDRMLPDYDNLRVAFEHAIAEGDIDTALRLVTSLSEFVFTCRKSSSHNSRFSASLLVRLPLWPSDSPNGELT